MNKNDLYITRFFLMRTNTVFTCLMVDWLIDWICRGREVKDAPDLDPAAISTFGLQVKSSTGQLIGQFIRRPVCCPIPGLLKKWLSGLLTVLFTRMYRTKNRTTWQWQCITYSFQNNYGSILFFGGGGALNFFTKRGQILCTMLMMFQTSTSR